MVTRALLFILFAAPPVLGATVEDACPPGAVEIVGIELFDIFNKSCYLFMTYDEVFYDTARLKCQQHNGTLAMPKTREMNDFLLRGMEQLHQTKQMWIGIQYSTLAATPVWEDGEIMEWDNFAEDVPKNISVDGNCVLLHPGDGKWRIHRCSDGPWYSSEMPFICEYHQVAVEEDSTDQIDVGGDLCPPLNCPNLSCGMAGFKVESGCQICECDS